MSVADWVKRPASREFEEADLGDPRRTRRLCDIAEGVSADPSASFPKIFSTTAELEGFYRFLRSEHVGWEKILEPHWEASCKRGAELEECLVIHDTTEFNFRGERDGVGPTSSNGKGFFAHASLLVGSDAARTPLGVISLEQYARGKGRKSKKLKAGEESEDQRWLRGARLAEERANGRFECIHVADREADTFHFLHGLVDLGTRFVVRVAQDRNLEDEGGEKERLHLTLMGLEAAEKFEIELSARDNRGNARKARTHPSRRSRTVEMNVAGASVVVPEPREGAKGSQIEMNVVRVWEAAPQSDEPAVEWILWTSEPIKTGKQLRRVVDIYRARWVIEEYFKALKTGCNLEKRQLESFDTLSAAVAVFAPVAWKMLLLRAVARSHPTSPPTTVLTPLQLKYLEHKYKQPIKTARDALLATAKLGGHLKQNGEPGWQTLGKGYETLVAGEAFLEVLNPPPTCDQS